MIITSNNLNEVRKQILKVLKEKPGEEIIIKAYDEEFNKKVLEIKGVNALLAPEFSSDKDKMKQRSSGLNEHLCRLAKKNNIKILIDLSEIKKLDKINKARIISRVIQNIELCKRTKTDMQIYPKTRIKQDILSFFVTLKGSTEQVKTSIDIQDKLSKKSGLFSGEKEIKKLREKQ